jgi:putative transposase
MTKSREIYPTDLDDTQYACIAPLLSKPNRRGAPRRVPYREILNAIFYLLKTGSQWRLLPHDFPNWKTVYHYFRLFRRNGLWETINQKVRETVRQVQGRQPQPSLMLVDCQTVKSAEGGEAIGFDGGKKVNGRKRTLMTDTQGWVDLVQVGAANVQDVHAGQAILEELEQHPELRVRLKKVLADGGFRGDSVQWAKVHLGIALEIVLKPEGQKGFAVLPQRWVIERTFAWLSRQRRLARDYERLPQTSEAWIYVAMIRLGLRRLSLI